MTIKTLDIKDHIDGAFDGKKSTLRCHHFNAPTSRTMWKLGEAFAAVARKLGKDSRKEQKAKRIGLSARRLCGKSTFTGGLMSTFNNKAEAESANLCRTQTTWDCGKSGHIRHYDAEASKDHALPSYLANDAGKKFGYPLVDIVEHPQEDKNATPLDALVSIKVERGKQNKGNRIVTIMVSPELEDTKAFRKFLEKAEPMKRKEALPKLEQVI